MDIIEEKIAKGMSDEFVKKYITNPKPVEKPKDDSLPDLTSMESVLEWYKKNYLSKYGIPMSRRQIRMLTAQLKKKYGNYLN